MPPSTRCHRLVCAPRRLLRWPPQRLLVVAQQAKDTLTIVLLLANGFKLIFGIIFGIAVPGLVLYGRRWRHVGPRGGPSARLWALSLRHELTWVVLFCADQSRGQDSMHS